MCPRTCSLYSFTLHIYFHVTVRENKGKKRHKRKVDSVVKNNVHELLLGREEKVKAGKRRRKELKNGREIRKKEKEEQLL